MNSLVEFVRDLNEGKEGQDKERGERQPRSSSARVRVAASQTTERAEQTLIGLRVGGR
jgi:hypothetical protein